MTERIGQVFGNYRLTHLLGQGGFADVYLGEHVHLNTWAAIKVLRTQVTSSDVLDFRNEARMIAHLEHPHIVQFLDFGVEDNTPFLVMAYAPGGTLRQRHPRGVPLASESIVLYVKQVASALQYAHHQKLIHRDIKPENMLLGRNNEILLSDFGIALVTPSARLHSLFAQSTSELAGTLTYMAPEQIQGKPSQASDQYALGVVVYEWLTGVPPFDGPYTEIALKHVSVLPPSLRERVPTMPPDVEKVVLTALAKDPQHRFASVQAFANALEQACQRQPPLIMSQPTRSPSVWANPSREPPLEAALFGPSGRMILGLSVVTIGREPTNQLIIHDAKVSSHHAEIRPLGQGHSIVDLDSTNGTFVNEQRLAPGMPRPLNWGDTIRVGDTTLGYAGGSATQKKALNPDGPTELANSSGYGGVFAQVVPPPIWPSTPEPQWPPPPPPPSHTGYGVGVQQVSQSGAPPLFPPPPPLSLNTSSGVPIRSFNNVAPIIDVAPMPQAYQSRSLPLQEWGSIARTTILAVLALVIILAGIGAFFVIHNNQVVPIQNSSPPVSSSPISLPTVSSSPISSPSISLPTVSISLVSIIIIVALFLIGAIWLFVRQRRLSDVAEITQTQPRPAKRTQLSLFSIARARLENSDKAYIDKTYSVEAGISRHKFRNFKALPFDLFVPNVHEPIQFDISLHASDNIELTSEWQKDLRYDPQNTRPQLVGFRFKAIAPGPCSLTVDFYRERHLLQTINIEFEAIEQPTPATTAAVGR